MAKDFETLKNADRFKKTEADAGLIRLTPEEKDRITKLDPKDQRAVLNAINQTTQAIIKEATKPEMTRGYMPLDLKTITDKVLKNQLSKENYKGKEEVKDLGLVEKWESEGVEYFINEVNLSALKNPAPKVFVSQDKNIKTLLALTEKQQFKNEDKKAEATFTLKDYALLRGYSDKEIQLGGKFLAELKKDLFSGAYTTYKIDKIKIDNRVYTAHGIPNFYTLLEPENKKGEWRVLFNPFYSESILRVLRQERGQYYAYLLKEVADRETTRSPYLHLFFNQLVYRKRQAPNTLPKKVKNLLAEMGLPDKVLKRPQESFNVLKECLSFVASKYPEELESIKLYNNFNKNKTKEMPLSSLKDLESWGYKDFKEILKAIEVSDIREAFISFVRPQRIARLPEPAREPKLDEEALDLILSWADNFIDFGTKRKITRQGTEKFLKDALRLLGRSQLYNLYRIETQKTYPNAFVWLTKTLPREIKRNRTAKGL